MLTQTRIKAIRPLRYAKKYFDGGGLYLLVTPTGAQSWRYRYRFAGKDKTLVLGTCEFVDLARARIRHQFARHLLAKGIDPAALKSEDKQAYASMVRDWEMAPENLWALPPYWVKSIRAMRRRIGAIGA